MGILSRFLLAWIGLSVLGFLFFKSMIIQFVPAVSWMMEIIQPDYSVELLFKAQDDTHIHIISTLNVSIPPLSKGDVMSTSSNLLPFVMFLVIIYSLLMAWPAKSYLSGIKRLVLSLPVSFVLAILVMSLQLLAVNELTLQLLSHQFDFIREKPWFLTEYDFVKNSESWLRSIALAILGSAILPRVWLKNNQ